MKLHNGIDLIVNPCLWEWSEWFLRSWTVIKRRRQFFLIFDTLSPMTAVFQSCPQANLTDFRPFPPLSIANVFYGRPIGCSHKRCSYIPTLYFATLHNMRALTQCESCMKKMHLQRTQCTCSQITGLFYQQLGQQNPFSLRPIVIIHFFRALTTIPNMAWCVYGRRNFQWQLEHIQTFLSEPFLLCNRCSSHVFETN